MPNYNITYESENTYTDVSSEAILEFLICPEDNDSQEIHNLKMESSPNINPSVTTNSFGFKAYRYRLKNLGKIFKVVFSCIVQKKEVNPYNISSLPLIDEQLTLTDNTFIINQYPYLNITECTQTPDNFTVPKKSQIESIFSFVKRINSFVYSFLEYNTEITDPQRKLNQTIEERSGVCQDFAHLMISILRQNNIPARYVCGYLCQGRRYVGTGAVHAWVQAFMPGTGWIGFDPTNQLLEDHNYIKIAHGLDINDCSTLKGVIKGTSENHTNYQVLIEKHKKGTNQ